MEDCVLGVDPTEIMKQAFQAAPKKEWKDRPQRPKPVFTHFLSIPVGYDDGIKKEFSKIFEMLAAECKLPEKLITRPSMLHLTMLMLDLSDEAKVIRANWLLNKLRPSLMSEFFEKGSLYLTFKGLKTF